jgi:cytochrome c-type biogenesis protein CcmH
MMLWIVFALMTAAAIGAVLWPLARRPAGVRGGRDSLVYRDQLDEIARDRVAGLIGEAEAQAARVELSRRLLAAADEEAPAAGEVKLPPLWHRRFAAMAALTVVPAVALGFYLALGSPDVPAQSAFSRVETPQEGQSIAGMIGQVEAHLAHDPGDGKGWEVIAPVYLRLGRFDDAVLARRKSIALNGDSPARDADLGEALVAAANGVVTDEAKHAFEKSVAGDAQQEKARYFLGLADEQDGNREAAAAKWRAMLDGAPTGAPWANFVRAALARVTGEAAPAPGPGQAEVAAAANMSDGERTDMIRGMVQRLAARLRSDGNDVDGWLRLVRAYVVLGDRDKAKGAVTDAKRALSEHPDQIQQIDDLVKGLGLEG